MAKRSNQRRFEATGGASREHTISNSCPKTSMSTTSSVLGNPMSASFSTSSNSTPASPTLASGAPVLEVPSETSPLGPGVVCEVEEDEGAEVLSFLGAEDGVAAVLVALEGG